MGSQVLGEDRAQRGVGAVHPAPGRHAVGHVHNLILGEGRSGLEGRSGRGGCGEGGGEGRGPVSSLGLQGCKAANGFVGCEVSWRLSFVEPREPAVPRPGVSRGLTWPKSRGEPLAFQCRSSTCRTQGRSPEHGRECWRMRRAHPSVAAQQPPCAWQKQTPYPAKHVLPRRSKQPLVPQNLAPRDLPDPSI